MKTLALTLVSLSLILSACNKPAEKNYQNTESRPTSVGKIFPHTDVFKKTGLHGQSYLEEKSLCLQCHGVDAKGGSSKISCYGCHADFPHASNWANPSNHGSAFIKAEKKGQCMKCHTPNENKASAVTCVGCHAAFPHDEDFKSGMHGELATTFKGKCLVCHTDMKRNMPNAESCSTCHFGSQLQIQTDEATGAISLRWQEIPAPLGPDRK